MQQTVLLQTCQQFMTHCASLVGGSMAANRQIGNTGECTSIHLTECCKRAGQSVFDRTLNSAAASHHLTGVCLLAGRWRRAGQGV